MDEYIQLIKISIIVEDIWHTLESNHESWNPMNTGTIKEVAYQKCHQFEKSSTQTATSTCPTMWIKVSRSNIVVHHLITGHWCIPLIDARSPTENENGNQGTRVQNHKCENVLRSNTWEDPSIRGHWCIPKKFRWRENLPLMTANLKELKMTLDSYPRINDLKSMGWNLLEGGH